MKFLSFVIIAMVLAVSFKNTLGHTPAYVWASIVKGEKAEHMKEYSTESVSEDIKNILANTDANSLIVYVRPGMTTDSLNNLLLNNNKIVSMLRKTNRDSIEVSYTNLIGESLDNVIKQYEGAKYFSIASQTDLDALKLEIENAAKPFIHKVYIVELPFEQDEVFDDVVTQIERTFETRTLNNHISIITGTSTAVRNLQDVDVEPTTEEESAEDTTDYLTSNILTKNLISVPIALLLITALLQLFYVKTPTLFVDKGIDFGKIEK